MWFYLTERRIEANPDKYEAIVQMSAPTLKKEVQKLNEMLTVINRFILKFSQHTFPFYRLLRKNSKFECTPECKRALKSLKKVLVTSLVPTRPLPEKILYLYLVIFEEAVSSVLIRELGSIRNMVYFILKALVRPETNYEKIEKITLALVTTSIKL